MTATRCWAMAGILLSAPAGAAWGQRGGGALLKTDLIELLSNPVIPKEEVASLVRRNCLAFHPTERDWVDIRRLGASPELVASITGCSKEAVPATTEPQPASLQVVVRQPRVVADAGSEARIVVLAAVGGMPQAGVKLALRGSGRIDGGSGRDIVTTADDSGFAVFALRVGRRLNTYRLEVAPAAGGALPGRPAVDLTVRPGPPASAYVEPRAILFDQGLDSIVPVAVTVRDSVGYPVAWEPVELSVRADEARSPLQATVTDSLGRARLVVARSAVPQGGTLQVKLRGRPLAWIEVLAGAPLSEAGTGFLPPSRPGGAVQSALGDALVFEARTKLGSPAVARAVTFTAVNASVSPTTATTDSLGRVRVGVRLGDRVGPAVVMARIDSLEKQVTLQVEPGPAVALVLEHNGVRVDDRGRWLVVPLGTTFVVRVRALDAYSNVTSVTRVARTMRENQPQFAARLPLVRLLGVQEDGSAVMLTFTAMQAGRAHVTLNAEGISASLWLEVVPAR
jgi:hypothetical protein